jgi:proteasome accessory factor B
MSAGSFPTAKRAANRRGRTGISFEDMAARRAERLVNLVICLLSTRQFIGAERIRDAVPGYEAADGSRSTDEAFKRMFERDKAELRDLGIPLETGRNSSFDAEEGYRITRRDYELPPIEFDAAEAAAIGLAARLWQSATLGEPARAALLKLRAAGTDVQATGTPGAVPHVDASDPSLPVLLDAARTSRPVQFDYVKSGEREPLRRTLEPWGVLSWRRRWYVAGFDRDRGEARSFRLSRIVGPVELIGRAGEFERPAAPAGRQRHRRRTDHHVHRSAMVGPGHRRRRQQRRGAGTARPDRRGPQTPARLRGPCRRP